MHLRTLMPVSLLAPTALLLLAAQPTQAQDRPISITTSKVEIRQAAPPNAALRYWRIWSAMDPVLLKQIEEEFGDGKEFAPPSKDLSEQMAACSDLNALLRATRIESCDWGIDYEDGFGALLPHLGKLRASARALDMDARRLIAAGDSAGAAERLAGMFRLAAHASPDNILISSLVSIAIAELAISETERQLDAGKLSPQDAAVVLSAARGLAGDDAFHSRRSIEGEQDILVAELKKAADDPVKRRELVAMAQNNPEKPDPISGLSAQEFSLAAAQAREPYALVVKAWNAPDAEEQLKQLESRVENHEFGPIAEIVLPSVRKAHASDRKAVARISGIVTSLENASK